MGCGVRFAMLVCALVHFCAMVVTVSGCSRNSIPSISTCLRDLCDCVRHRYGLADGDVAGVLLPSHRVPARRASQMKLGLHL